MSEEDNGDRSCHWGACAETFETAKQLDQHVENVHIKAKKAAAAGGGKAGEKGMVCEWANCDSSEKIFRDSWNLVTHMRYKHTHFKVGLPFCGVLRVYRLTRRDSRFRACTRAAPRALCSCTR
jgi:hypothetical protein